ncbi:adenosylcobinamide kinase/adenosylcobinamide-phosphate guanylyltransferase [Vibrio nigripulchritudo ATCC 27043]|uniref:bifunctional adenosylcobinamide kinase/adenosylcobinamide-phosphate guanylyltransferase n=1 Tax=Vibrio nigripulchritudo TaxID=28173 RepID=UPI00021C181F|nr:bifunctional adenosylcobinamide kinase/adenosylcobinamide-phosphate guanylyltransferase [Vibrio nigripulchritudo]EGU60531.1 adenosylcobinamide kinase/adenosylcobinamide-phosphate guanylyltransferase [Vibrio nigripulchritudo ATCC 27043]
MGKTHLILGGARSGKSSYAEEQASSQVLSGKKLIYIATATSFDDEMTERIGIHQKRRGARWELIETPTELPTAISQLNPGDTALVDCLTLWLNNVLFELGDNAHQDQVNGKIDKLLVAISECQGNLVIVSNEVGMGIVPIGRVTRLFVDNAGWMNQKVAKISDDVTFVAAGLPLVLKGSQ